MYINNSCEFFGEEDSLIKDIAEQQMLADQLGLTDKKQFKL